MATTSVATVERHVSRSHHTDDAGILIIVGQCVAAPNLYLRNIYEKILSNEKYIHLTSR